MGGVCQGPVCTGRRAADNRRLGPHTLADAETDFDTSCDADFAAAAAAAEAAAAAAAAAVADYPRRVGRGRLLLTAARAGPTARPDSPPRPYPLRRGVAWLTMMTAITWTLPPRPDAAQTLDLW